MSPFHRHFSLVNLKKERESRRNCVTLLKTTEISFLSITLRLNCHRSAQFHRPVVLFKMAAELLLFPGSWCCKSTRPPFFQSAGISPRFPNFLPPVIHAIETSFLVSSVAPFRSISSIKWQPTAVRALRYPDNFTWGWSKSTNKTCWNAGNAFDLVASWARDFRLKV